VYLAITLYLQEYSNALDWGGDRSGYRPGQPPRKEVLCRNEQVAVQITLLFDVADIYDCDSDVK
jgi:hypothetical protein